MGTFTSNLLFFPAVFLHDLEQLMEVPDQQIIYGHAQYWAVTAKSPATDFRETAAAPYGPSALGEHQVINWHVS